MSHPHEERTRSLTIIAQDPSIRPGGRILRAVVDVRAENMAAGPWGHRVQVIDFDASTGTLYQPLDPARYEGPGGIPRDPFSDVTDRQLLEDPRFHAQNVYAIVMRILGRFEFALGRRVGWGFDTHQLKVAPHAFVDANAFYSSEDEALVFGYFPARKGGTVFSALSHDVVAHETTHAIIDGLREHFLDPSSPDQAAFHEGYADVVALLSVFSLPGITEVLIDHIGDSPARRRGRSASRRHLVRRSAVTATSLRESILLGLAEQMGSELSGVRGHALRRSVTLKPSPEYYRDPVRHPDYLEAHQRGEILVAAVLDAFVNVWAHRLEALGEVTPGHLDRARVVEEGAEAADYLLTMVIRALDYTPPTHLLFSDFLSALVTADLEIRPNDRRYRFRRHLIEGFGRFGIKPASSGTKSEPGAWDAPTADFSFARSRFESMLRDPEEVFGFIWENRKELGIFEGAYGKVESVRPCLRIGPDDGFPLRETVAEFYQVLKISADELGRYGLRKPEGMAPETPISLYGGNTLVFDEYGRLKYNIHNRIDETKRQQPRLDYLWRYGFYNPGSEALRRVSALHLRRGMAACLQPETEGW
jgi:hypothetical protein